MFYKNTSYTAKTFYGVTFKPGETKEVNGIINNRWLVPCDKPKTSVKNVQQKPSSEPTKVVANKPAAAKEVKHTAPAQSTSTKKVTTSTKLAETKSAPKPAESKPTESKTVNKTTDSKPADNKPADNKSADSKAADIKSTDKKKDSEKPADKK